MKAYCRGVYVLSVILIVSKFMNHFHEDNDMYIRSIL